MGQSHASRQQSRERTSNGRQVPPTEPPGWDLLPVQLWSTAELSGWVTSRFGDAAQTTVQAIVQHQLDGMAVLTLGSKGLLLLFGAPQLSPELLVELERMQRDWLADVGESDKQPFPDRQDIPVGDPQAVVRFFHTATEHGKQTVARAARQCWSSQPSVFGRFYGAPWFPLALGLPSGRPSPPTFEELFGPNPPRPSGDDLSDLAALLYHSLAISAANFDGVPYFKRCNPSSGGLHPVEAYIVGRCPPLGPDGLTAAVMHYTARNHGLEARATLPDGAWAAATEASGLPDGAMLIGLSSLDWREVWKYGERGWRYCQLDLGHAAEALAMAARLVGWRIEWLNTVETQQHFTGTSDCGELNDGVIASLLGLNRHRKSSEDAGRGTGLATEQPGLIGVLHQSDDVPVHTGGMRCIQTLYKQVSSDTWRWHDAGISLIGRPPARWNLIPAIQHATAAMESPVSMTEPVDESHLAVQPETRGKLDPILLPVIEACIPKESSLPIENVHLSAASVFRNRRSQHQFSLDGPPLPRAIFINLLEGLRRSQAVAQTKNKQLVPLVGIYVNQVAGIEPGRYLYRLDQCARLPDNSARGKQPLATSCPGLIFVSTESTTAGITEAPTVSETRDMASEASCGQALARDSHFTVAFFARLNQAAESDYRRAHWCCGMLGQQLYCAAEASPDCSIGACGMGCFLDDLASMDFGVGNGSDADTWTPCLYYCAVGRKLSADSVNSCQSYNYEDRLLPQVSAVRMPIASVEANNLCSFPMGELAISAARQLATDLREHGFAIVVPDHTCRHAVADARTAAAAFLRDTPIDQKRLYTPIATTDEILGPRQPNRGYIANGDRSEYFKAMVSDDPVQRWPPSVAPAYSRGLGALFSLCWTAVQRLVSIGELDEESVAAIEPFVREGTALSTILYHPQTFTNDSQDDVLGASAQPSLGTSAQPDELHPTLQHLDHRQCSLLRAGNKAADSETVSRLPLKVASEQHCDTGILTAVRVGEVPGLEIFDFKIGSWVLAERLAKPGQLLVMPGHKLGMLAAKSRTPLPPTVHRVRFVGGVPRVSTLLFLDFATGVN